MANAELSTTTVRYLFASTWAAPAESGWNMRVPDAKVAGLETAASLLNLAVWSLREAGLVDVQQIRPAKAERVVTMGGRSFTRVTAVTRPVEPPAGLEGALLAKIAEPPEAGLLGGLDDALAGALSRDDPNGLRGFILALSLSSGSPWSSVGDYCRIEAEAAGIVGRHGRVFKKLVVTDRAALEALRPRDAEIAAARQRYREREAEFDEALFGDCVAALDWAHSSSD